MIILIDAYNVFKTVLHNQFVEKNEQIRFLNIFETYASIRNHKIILVFDGENNKAEFTDNYQLITIYYSGYKQTADDIIKKQLKILQGQDLLLVTSDRDICKFAMQYSIQSISSQRFYTLLQAVVHSKDQQDTFILRTIQKTSTADNPYLDRLMEIGSRQLITKEQDKEIKSTMRSRYKEHNSKKDRKLLKQIAKI